MRLKWFYVREFQSVRDSGVVNVDDITCLVGKNEAGKTALLKALYRLNPIVGTESTFDVTTDYPGMDVEDYRIAVESNERDHATPIKACYNLDETELTEIKQLFGEKCVKTPELILVMDYENKRTFTLDVDDTEALKYLIEKAGFSEQTYEAVKSAEITTDALIETLQEQEQTREVSRVLTILHKVKERDVNGYIYDNILRKNSPKFLYFDEYYQLTGHENIDNLIWRESNNQLKSSDYPLLGLIHLARLQLSDLLNPGSTISLRRKLEGASNHLTKQVLKYWSQNKHLQMTFDVRPAMPGDPEGLRTGTNIWGGVLDTRHRVTTELGSRSRGFIWFFSFLAWYSDIKRNSGPVILLLDEPGMTLHGKAQYDLLRYFEIELKESHQLIYTTHSPFMVDPLHFERVRIVQDRSIDADGELSAEDSGTKVLTEIFEASDDSLFPSQGALGYDLHQTLFIGPYSLVVEGVADLLYLQTISGLLEAEGMTGLDPKWTITPVGGSAKVPTFVALLGAQKNMTIATLIDYQTSDHQKIEALYKEKLLKKANVLSFADFTKAPEADVEDMFTPEFYIDLVNTEFAAQLPKSIDITQLTSKHPRVLVRIEEYLKQHPLKSGQFSHFRPARYFSENASQLALSIPAETKNRFNEAFVALNKLI